MRLLVLAALLLGLAALGPVRAEGDESPTVHAILFHSPTCASCHLLITDTLPPLRDRYGNRLALALVDVTTAEGRDLYYAAVDQFEVDGFPVPLLLMGDRAVVGGAEIAQALPGLVEQGLEKGGVPWPALAGFRPPDEAPREAGLAAALRRDAAGNVLSVAVLGGMVFALARVVGEGVRTLRAGRETGERPRTLAWRAWAVLAVCVMGLAAAGYVATLQAALAEAACGPVGDCDAVHRSERLMFAGGIPGALMGVTGYVVALLLWLWDRFGAASQGWARALLLGTALSGTVGSIYVTFLQPFVIGATSLWCLAAAAGAPLLLLLVGRPGWEAVRGAICGD